MWCIRMTTTTIRRTHFVSNLSQGMTIRSNCVHYGLYSVLHQLCFMWRWTNKAISMRFYLSVNVSEANGDPFIWFICDRTPYATLPQHDWVSIRPSQPYMLIQLRPIRRAHHDKHNDFIMRVFRLYRFPFSHPFSIPFHIAQTHCIQWTQRRCCMGWRLLEYTLGRRQWMCWISQYCV